MSFMRMRDLCMSRLVRNFARCNHVYLGSGQAATVHLAHLQTRAHIQRGRRFFETTEGNARIHKSTKQHIAADARKALKITNSHRSVILNCSLCAAFGKDFGGQQVIQ